MEQQTVNSSPILAENNVKTSELVLLGISGLKHSYTIVRLKFLKLTPLGKPVKFKPTLRY